MTVAAIGDIHYEKLDHRIPNFSGMVSTTLRNTIDKAMRRGASAIVLVGDIFNSPYPTQDSVVEFLDVITDFDIEVHTLLGNHDFANVLTNSLKIAKWTRKLKSNLNIIDKPTMMKIDGIRYQFLPHPYVEDMSPKADFAFGHFAVSGATGDNGFKIKSKNQPKGNWVLGDFHTAQEGKTKKCVYEYVGSLTQLSWEEDSRKTFLMIEDGEKHRHKVEQQYKLAQYTISSDEELDKCVFDKNTFYYMKTTHGYVLPKGWSLEHPEVIRQSAVGAKKDKRAALLSPTTTTLKPLDNLEPYLLSKKIDPTIVKRATKLAQAIDIRSAA